MVDDNIAAQIQTYIERNKRRLGDCNAMLFDTATWYSIRYQIVVALSPTRSLLVLIIMLVFTSKRRVLDTTAFCLKVAGLTEKPETTHITDSVTRSWRIEMAMIDGKLSLSLSILIAR